MSDTISTTTDVFEPRPATTIAVLLVDDRPFVGMVVGRLLVAEPDIQLHCCLHSADAIAQANQLRPDLIFQDLQMPDIDGLTMVGLYRLNQATSTTPIVIMSATDDATSRDRALAAGAADYLVKLPNKQALIACIRRHTHTARVSDSPSLDAEGHDDDLTLDCRFLGDVREASQSGGADRVAMLIDQFLGEASLLVDQFAQAAARRDGQALEDAAHTLKGTSLMFGARRLAALSGAAEAQAMLQPDAAVDATVTEAMVEELERVRVACAREKNAAVSVAELTVHIGESGSP